MTEQPVWEQPGAGAWVPPGAVPPAGPSPYGPPPPGHIQPGPPAPAQQQPGHPAPGHPAPGHPAPGYPATGYPQPGYPATGYAQPGYAQPGYPMAGWAGGVGAPAQPPAPATGPGRIHVEPVPGTTFGVAFLPVPPTVFGPAIGSMVAGIAAILVALFVILLGLATTPLATGAFTVTTSLVGGAAIVVGLLAARQIVASAGRLTGRGLAVAGLSCGATGLGLGLLGLLFALLLH